MSIKGGPDIETDGLVFHLDAAASNIGKGYSTEGLRVEYLVVGGGGGGGGWSTAGGGGAGGFLSGDTRLAAGTYTVTIGAGGTRGDNGSSRTGTTGGNSQLGNSLVAYGGGGGGSTSNINGLNGGSGGGGFCSSTAGVGGTGVSGQGNNGGNGGPGTWRSGSGGGAGQSGGLGNGGYGSAPGGRGKISKLDFIWKYYAGGGASGGCSNGDNSGGLGGGGNGGRTNADGTNGQTNLGGGGGGGGCYNTRATFGGHGGSGIVMIRYWGKQKATGGDTIQYKHGYTIHTFTSSGSFVLTESVDGTSTNKIVGELKNMGSSNYNSENKGYWTFDGTNERILLSQTVSGDHKTIFCSVYVVETLLGNSTGGQGPIISSSAGKTIWLGNFSSATIDEVLNIYDGSKFTFAKGPIYAGWRNFCFRWNNSYYDIFIDGIQTTSYIGATGANTHCSLLSNTFVEIGARSSSSQYFSGRYQTTPPGQISNISIYNISLSDRQILDNYNATKGRFGL